MARKNYNKFFNKESKEKTSNDQEAIKVGQGGFAKALNDESLEKKSEEVQIEPQKIGYDKGRVGEDVTVLKNDGKAYYMTSEDDIITISENKPEPPKLNFTEKQVAKCSFLNIRETPDVNAKVVGMVKRDAIVHVLIDDGEWSKILIPGNRTERYVKSEFLTLRKVF